MRQARQNLLERALGSVRGAFLTVGLFSLFINLMMLVAPIYMLQVYDRVLTSQSRDTLLALTGLAVLLIMLSGFVEVARSRLLVRIGADLDAQLRGPLFASAFAARHAGNGASQPLRDLDHLRSFLTGAGIIALFDAPWAPIYLAVIFMFHPVLGMVALSGAIVILLLAIAAEVAVRRPLEAAGRCSLLSSGFIDTMARNR
jgi:ABC-type protease/lipase transport system fused ATPase/permease subunit